MPKELKKYELEAAARPRDDHRLSTTALVTLEDGSSGYCYIRFAPALAVAVGSKLECGISSFLPAYLHVVQRNGKWEVWALYVKTDRGAMLWSTPEKPQWLNFYTPKSNASHKTDKTTRATAYQGPDKGFAAQAQNDTDSASGPGLR